MLVKVVNDNVFPYSEKYKGEMVHIPAKGFIKMDLNEASHFLGTMPGNIQVDANGIQKPESYKMLRIEKLGDEPLIVEGKKYVCHACNRDLQTKSAYEAHIEKEHLESLVDDDAKEKIQKRGPGKTKRGVTGDTIADRDGGEAKI